jgi:hypothetical protein
MTSEQPKYPPMPIGPPKTHEPIKVRRLLFARQGTGQGIPLGAPFPADPIILAAGPRGAGGDEIQIQYEPWHRQYRARYVANGVTTGERCIPEGWAIYEPELT